MHKLKSGDLVEIEIHGVKFYVRHEGEGFSICKDDASYDSCIAYMDGFYLDDLDEKHPTRDPHGKLSGKPQLLVYDIPASDPVARAVWHGDSVVVSVADGQAIQMDSETVFVSDGWWKI